MKGLDYPVVSGNSNRQYSCRFSVIVAEQSPKALAASDLPFARREFRFDDFVIQPVVVPLVVVPLVVVMLTELIDRTSQGGFPNENHPIKTF